MRSKKKLIAKDYSFFLLSRKDYTKKEMEKKLKLKGFSSEEIAEAINILEDYRYIDEKKYIKIYLKYLLARKKSPQEIKYKMLLKGFAKEDIDGTVKLNYQEEAEKNIIRFQVEKYRQKTEDSNKIIKKLLSKGFNYEYIVKILEEYDEN